MIQSFNEFIDFYSDIKLYSESMKKDDSKPDEVCSDTDGPCKGKPFNKIGSEGHLAAMQHHTAKFNAIKNGKDFDASDFIKKTGLSYHTKMYQAHKDAMSKK